MYNKLKKWKLIKQKSDEWFNKRKTIITASDVSSIFEVNPFKSKYQLLLDKKNKDFKEVSNVYTNWGEKYEPLAKQHYESMPLIDGERRVHDVGLIIHEKYKWLGASPDGVVEFKDDKNKWYLLEIKCPYKREIKSNYVPRYIWIQIQIQLEVCNISHCHLLQCKYGNKDVLLNNRLNIIKRDKKWFNEIAFPVIEEFWDMVGKYRMYSAFKNPYPNPNEWVSLKTCTGYLLDDPLIDWLSYYKNEPELKKYVRYDGKYINSKNKSLKLFINNIINFSKKKYSLEYVSELNEKCNEGLSVYKNKKTIDALKKGVDIIIRPVLLDYKYKIFGIPHVIMKKEIVDIFFKSYSNKLNFDKLEKDSYVIIFMSLKNNFSYLNKWNKVILKRYSYYASIINSVLKVKNTSVLFTGKKNCGVFLNDDSINIKECVKWMKKVKNNGKEWFRLLDSNEPPDIKELMPNMCNRYDSNWYSLKKILAEKWGELTLLWYVGYEQRKNAHKKNLYSWKEDKPVNDMIKAMYSNYTVLYSNRKNIIRNMINVNTSKSLIYLSRDKGRLTEPYIDTNNALELFIDFEVLSGNRNRKYSSRSSVPKEIIYLIGTSWKNGDNVEFKSFCSKDLTHKSEKNLLDNWWKFITDLNKDNKYSKIILYHWSSAEESFIKRAIKRHSLYDLKDDLNSGYYDLRDLMEMYIESETVIKNVWNYSVKSVAKGLYKYGLIPEIWEDDEKGGNKLSGEQLIFSSKKCYDEIKETGEIIERNTNFQSIIAYNRIDCNVLYYLLDFLRKNVYSSSNRQKRKNKRDGLYKKRKKIRIEINDN